MPVTTPQELQTDTESPYDQKQKDLELRTLVCVPKAYRNESFLGSREARTIRIMCEFEETLKRLKDNGVEGTFLFFGSARAMYRSDWQQEMTFAKKKLASASSAKEKEQMGAKISRLEKTEWLCDYVDKAEQLSYRLTEWAMSDSILQLRGEGAVPAGGFALQHPNHSYLTSEGGTTGRRKQAQFVVSTGGGPGLMEAANKGAAKVPGARSAGFAISLPFEKGLNPYVTPELAFTYHYFFTRKYWMLYPCKALIVAPGGFGTFDELFESVTLKQTGKKPPFPVVLIGKDYWKRAIDWDFISEKGVISRAEVDSMLFTDSIDEAFKFITDHIIKGMPRSPMKPQVNTGDTGSPSAKRQRTDGATLSPTANPTDAGEAAMALSRARSPLSRPADV